MAQADIQEGRQGRLEHTPGPDHRRVVERVTGERTVANEGQRGQRVTGSEDDPRYVVESDGTGKRAAHRADALERR